jgi:hypothetical protein
VRDDVLVWRSRSGHGVLVLSATGRREIHRRPRHGAERAQETTTPCDPRVAVEHALYGDLVFSIGIGGMFVNGVRLLAKALG